MTGRGSIRHNNRSFSAANVDRSRSGQNVTFCNEDLKKVYHELFDEALAAYNAKKKKTRDKIPDYYEHIRQSKQEKLFHEAIFQIGNLTDCGCGSRKGSGRCWTFWISTCRSSSGLWSKRRGSCYLCQRCSSRKENRNGATPGAVWSVNREKLY